MKTITLRNVSTLSALLLFGLIYPSHAMPPIPRAFKGSIERIDGQNRELVITNSQTRILLSWTGTTRFQQTCLNSRDTVIAYYRKEAGRPVAREIRAAGPTICSKCCN